MYAQDEQTREFRDPVHRFIQVYSHEKAVIDTPEFQRLRRIRQLGLGCYVYHGAEHSRFGHSLGVMHLAGEAVRHIIGKNFDLVRDVLSWPEETSQARKKANELFLLARLTGLLHDIGHAPFSHASEHLFPKKASGAPFKHEDYTVAIIRSSRIASIIDSVAESTGVKSEDVCNALSPTTLATPGFLLEIINSPWDVDKMDYLLRDASYCGVAYGHFDLERLVGSLTLTSGPGGELNLAIEEGGIHVLESLVLARYFMFTQVYFHRVRRAFDLLLGEFISERLQTTTSASTYPPPDQVRDYLKWDDAVVLAQAVESQDERNRNIAWQLLARDHPRAVYETMPHPSAITQARVSALYSKISLAFPGVPFWLDKAIDHPERFRKVDVPIVRLSKGAKQTSFVTASAALRGLDEIGQVRLYADIAGDRTLRSQLEDFCQPYTESEL